MLQKQLAKQNKGLDHHEVHPKTKLTLLALSHHNE